MRKLKIYIDTSVISNLTADDAPEQKEYSLKLWKEIKDSVYEVYISGLVLVEIQRCPEPKRTILNEYLTEIQYKDIQLDEETAQIAREYIEAGIIPVKYEEDALHIAAAVIHNCNAVVSWNFKHMVKLKTIIGVNGINKGMGYGEIEIISPLSLIGEEY